MAKVKPFRGVVYVSGVAGGISDLITPPYDVISPDEQLEYHDRNPHNIIHLDFGLDRQGDDGHENKYTRAARLLDAWLEEGVLERQKTPSLYVLEQNYELEDGVRKKRTGFIGLVKLEEFGAGRVLPHERTLSKPRADRLQLLRATRANLSQVFALFGDPTGTVDAELAGTVSGEPILEVVDYQGATDRMWRLSDPEAIATIARAMEDKVLFIADGHHRYETSLAYRDEMRKAHPNGDDGAYDYIMMMMVNMDRQELTILPTHRLVRGLDPEFPDECLAKCEQFFDVTEVERERTMQTVRDMQDLPAEHHVMALLAQEGPLRILKLKDDGIMDALVPSEYSEAWRTLDVAVLHALVFDHIIGLDSEIALVRGDVIFEQSVAECMRLVDEREYQAAFFLRATKIEQMREIAAREERMPQKSTFFYPKLPTGLVMNSLD